MAINAATNWYVRVAGNALNGGGYDSTISGAGTNYADADAAILSLTDFATSGAGSTTLTSATGGFTAAMVGNCVRMASGTNFQAGYYFITVYTDTNTVTLDRTPSSGGAGSGGTGRVGGAFATPWGNFSTGGTVTTPTITSPLAAGHTVWIRGAGLDTPASVNYSMGNNYSTYVNGTQTLRIKWIGYNGRPRIDAEMFAFNTVEHSFTNFWFTSTSVPTYSAYGIIHSSTNNLINNVIFDQAGYDRNGLVGGGLLIIKCKFINSGSTSSGTKAAIHSGVGRTFMLGSIINGWRGPGFYSPDYTTNEISDSIIANCYGGDGVSISSYITMPGIIIKNSTIYNNSGDGIQLHAATDDEATYGHITVSTTAIFNNIIYGNGGYGISAMKTEAENQLNRLFIEYNAYGDNTSGALDSLTASSTDITLSADPFTDAASGDFSLNNTAGGGALLRGTAYSLW